MAKPEARAGADRLALYDALLATNPAIVRKGAAMPYTSVNGNMFSLLTADIRTLALRLPAPARDDFLKTHKTTLCVQYGAVMPDYMSAFPPPYWRRPGSLRGYLALSYQYACSLKPKATTKKASAKRTATAPRAQAKLSRRSRVR